MKIKKINRKIIIPTVIIVVLIFGYLIFKKDEAPYEFVEARKGDLIQEVSVTGRVKPATSVDLSFERSGKIAMLSAFVGQRVFAGQTLAVLFNNDLKADLLKAEANLKAEEAKLDELNTGVGVEELLLYEAKLKNAQVVFDQSRQNAVDEINDAYTVSDDAIRNKIDSLFSNPKSSNPKFNFTSGNDTLKTEIEFQRILVEQLLGTWSDSNKALSPYSNLSVYFQKTKDDLNELKNFLEKISSVVNSLTPSANLTQTNIDDYKASVSTARTNINKAISDIFSASEKFENAQASFDLARRELSFKKSPSTPEKIRAQEAVVESAKAAIASIDANVAKTVLIAPISGLVTKVSPRTGEIVSAGEIVVSVISDNNFQIEANVTEVDIAKLSIGQEAKVTLDAYGSDVVFKASLVSIDPAETVVEGVSTYEVTLEFKDPNDKRIRSGMTANIDVLTAKKEGVIMVPQRAVVNKNGEYFVGVLSGNKVVETGVEIGLKDSYGEVEILSGISVGQKIIITTE